VKFGPAPGPGGWQPSRSYGINNSGHILILPLQVALRSIPAGTPAAPVDGVNGDMRFHPALRAAPPQRPQVEIGHSFGITRILHRA
jgi:hypothetical protein